MLGFLRERRVKKVLLWVIAILIVPAFALMGASYLTSNKKYVAKMYGKKIYNADFLSFKHNYGAYFMLNIGVSPFKNDETESYEKLWEQYKLILKAKKEKIKVSNDELLAFMTTFPLLNRGGKFNNQSYLSFLKRARIVPAQFEKFVKDMVAAEKYLEQEYAKIMLTDQEVLDSFKSENEKAEIEYIFISHRDTQIYLEQNANEDELKDFYNQKPETYTTLPEAKMRYVLVKDIPEDFNIKEINSLADASEALAADIITTDFFTVNDEIGELETQYFVAQETIDSPIGELNGPFPIDKGNIIFEKVEGKDPYVPAFSNVKEKVRKRFAYETAEAKAKERAIEIFEMLQQGKELDPTSKQFDVFYAKPKSFKLYDEVDEKLYLYGPFNRAVFSQENNGLMAEPFEFEHGWALVNRLAFEKANMDDFNKDKETYKNKLMQNKKEITYKRALRLIDEEGKLEFNKNQ